MLYRSYKPGDFAQICAIEKACFAPPLRFSQSYLRQIVSAHGAIARVAALEESEKPRELAGFAVAVVQRAEGGRIAYLETLEVLAAHRRHGVGRELLRQMIEAARAAGAQTFWLHVSEENEAAQRLYCAQAFTLQRREENYYSDGCHALLYARQISADGESQDNLAGKNAMDKGVN